jgi:hypothetical protein
VELTTKTRKDKNYGNIVGPWFEVVGWATLEDVRAGRKTAAAKPKPEPVAVTAPVQASPDLSDALPDWGKK